MKPVNDHSVGALLCLLKKQACQLELRVECKNLAAFRRRNLDSNMNLLHLDEKTLVFTFGRLFQRAQRELTSAETKGETKQELILQLNDLHQQMLRKCDELEGKLKECGEFKLAFNQKVGGIGRQFCNAYFSRFPDDTPQSSRSSSPSPRIRQMSLTELGTRTQSTQRQVLEKRVKSQHQNVGYTLAEKKPVISLSDINLARKLRNLEHHLEAYQKWCFQSEEFFHVSLQEQQKEERISHMLEIKEKDREIFEMKDRHMQIKEKGREDSEISAKFNAFQEEVWNTIKQNKKNMESYHLVISTLRELLSSSKQRVQQLEEKIGYLQRPGTGIEPQW